MSTEQHTALGGKLIRWAGDTWAWSDSTPAPQVRDMKPSWYYNFRVGSGCVEVPAKLTKTEAELAWVAAGGYPVGLSGDHGSTRTLHADGRETRTSDSGKAIPQVYLVPVADWDEWDAEACIGARWERADEAAILAKAKSLGWEAPQ